MKRNRRPQDQRFEPEELLYRRIPPSSCEGGIIDIDAIALPDISTVRAKYADTPEWALIDHEQGHDFRAWGVAAFPVSGIPPVVHSAEAHITLRFKAAHVPYDDNYPHTEVRAFESNGRHVNAPGRIPRDLSIRFRERLQRKMRLIHLPTEPDE